MKIKESLENYKRIIKICYKPTKEEFILSSKICAIGIIVIGLIGFFMYAIAILVGL